MKVDTVGRRHNVTGDALDNAFCNPLSLLAEIKTTCLSSVLVLRPHQTHITERCGVVVSTPASHSECYGFESRPGYLLSC
jgi:hypothetical protein